LLLPLLLLPLLLLLLLLLSATITAHVAPPCISIATTSGFQGGKLPA
jgi:hypothetical protein